jgi:hypothetical protein
MKNMKRLVCLALLILGVNGCYVAAPAGVEIASLASTATIGVAATLGAINMDQHLSIGVIERIGTSDCKPLGVNFAIGIMTTKPDTSMPSPDATYRIELSTVLSPGRGAVKCSCLRTEKLYYSPSILSFRCHHAKGINNAFDYEEVSITCALGQPVTTVDEYRNTITVCAQ